MLLFLIILLLVGCRAVIYLRTLNGLVELNSKEYSFFNSDLKLMCLTSVYNLGRFEPSMLSLEEATVDEIKMLPVDLFWNRLTKAEFTKLFSRFDFAPVLDHFVCESKHIIWKLVRESFARRSAALSRNFGIEKLSAPVLPFFWLNMARLLDPYTLILQYSPKLASGIVEIYGDEPMDRFWNLAFGSIFPSNDDEWSSFRSLIYKFMRAKEDGRVLDDLDTWKYFEDRYKYSEETSQHMSNIIKRILDRVDLDSKSDSYLQRCLNLYSNLGGLISLLGLFKYPSKLKNYMETQINLAQPHVWNIVWPLPFQVMGQTMLLLGSSFGASEPQEHFPIFFEDNFDVMMLKSHLDEGWLEEVALKDQSMQQALFWANTWTDSFPLDARFSEIILRNLDDLDNTSLPILLVMTQLMRSCETNVNFENFPSRNKLELSVLNKLIALTSRGRAPKIEEVKAESESYDENMVIDEDSQYWSLDEWEQTSPDRIAQLIRKLGMTSIYNSLQNAAKQNLDLIFTPEVFGLPGVSASIRLSDIEPDSAHQFISWILPRIDMGSFWSSITAKDIELLTEHWRRAGIDIDLSEYLNRTRTALPAMLAEIAQPPIMTLDRRPIDIVLDRMSLEDTAQGASILTQISESYWRDAGSRASSEGLETNDLRAFLTGPTLRGGRVRSNAFWKALHETIDIRELSGRDWTLITMMVVEKELQAVLVAGYLLGLIPHFPENIVPGLPFPSWMSQAGFSNHPARLSYLIPFLEESEKLQEGLLMAVKWNEDLRLPEDLVDWIVCNFWKGGIRKDLALIPLNYALRNPGYVLPDAPPSSRALFRVLHFISSKV